MPNSECFRYSIDFGFYLNPVARMELFRDDLRSYVATIDCDLFSNGLMNSVSHSTGLVYRESGTVKNEDRELLIQWFIKQTIKCTITMGPLEDHETASVVSDINGDVFDVDNLSDAEHAEALAKRTEIESKIEALQNRGRPT